MNRVLGAESGVTFRRWCAVLSLAAVVACGGDSTTGSGAAPVVSTLEQLVAPPSIVSAGEERAVSVRARNSIGAFVPAAEIQAQIVAGGGTASPGVAVTDADGVSRFVWRIGPVGGEQRLLLRALNGTGTLTLVTVASAPQRILNVSITGTGGGTVFASQGGISCSLSGGNQSGACSASYTQGTTVTLTASPAAGSTFAGWSGGGCSGTGSCVVTLSAATSVTATFTLLPPATQTLTLTTTGTGNGSVTSSPAGISCTRSGGSQFGTCSASYTQGTAVTLTASPAAGSTFAGWSGGGCSGTGSCAVTLSAATSVTATFTLLPPATQTLTLTTTGTGSGSVTSSPAGISCTRSGGSQSGTCSASYPSFTNVTLTASPAAGSTFAGWSGGGCSGTGSCVVNLSAATSVTATFTLAAACINSLTPGGSVSFQVGAVTCSGNVTFRYAPTTQNIVSFNVSMFSPLPAEAQIRSLLLGDSRVGAWQLSAGALTAGGLRQVLPAGTYDWEFRYGGASSVGGSFSIVSDPIPTNQCATSLADLFPGVRRGSVTFNSSLELGDCIDGVGKRNDVYTMILYEDRTLLLDLTSSTFDTFIEVTDRSTGELLGSDDDSGGGTNSRVILRSSTPRGVAIKVTHFLTTPAQGAYVLSVTDIGASLRIGSERPAIQACRYVMGITGSSASIQSSAACMDK